MTGRQLLIAIGAQAVLSLWILIWLMTPLFAGMPEAPNTTEYGRGVRDMAAMCIQRIPAAPTAETDKGEK